MRRSPWLTRTALVGAAALLAACGGDGDEPVRPLVDLIGPALAAVEAERGGPQAFFEVNATPQLVNVFVAADDATLVAPYVYVADELAPAGDPRPAEGATFAAGAVDLDPDTILAGVEAELPDADIVLFSVAGGPGGAVQYTATVRSERGAALDVVVGPDGSIVSVDAGG